MVRILKQKGLLILIGTIICASTVKATNIPFKEKKWIIINVENNQEAQKQFTGHDENEVLLLPKSQLLTAQVCFVNPKNGLDSNSGNFNAPVKTLNRALQIVNESNETTIKVLKLMPGYYHINDVIDINSNQNVDSENDLIIEASIMPDDSTWTPEKMPIIQSTSGNNSFKQFKHSVGLQINRSHVTVRGLKFIGNPNPKVKYYYPIAKENDSLVDLKISQCYFIGERYSSPIQGAIYTFGEGLNVNHCVFYNCRNGILRFYNKENIDYKNTITHNIIYGAYEGALWFDLDPELVFNNNIISNCQYFWIKYKGDNEKYKFTDCVITNIDYYVTTMADDGTKERNIENTNIEEINIKKEGEINLINNSNENLPKNYLHLDDKSVGHEFEAGIFRDK